MGKKLMIVFGTRPEAIKMAPVIKQLQSDNRFETIVTVTGQHREMLDQVLNIFEIHPDFDLNIMKSGQDLYDVTSRVLSGMRTIFDTHRPDMLLVHGDTTTSMAAALAAYYAQIPVGHVEAGLRTNNIYSPWPEEINRQITARIAAINFAPTETSKTNLLSENISAEKICVTGNTIIDALHLIQTSLHTSPSLRDFTDSMLLKQGYDVSRLTNNSNRKMVLITGHRRENFGEGFLNICKAIRKLAHLNENVDFVYPMHLNPNVRQPIHQVFGNDVKNALSNVFFIEPLEYISFNRMLNLSSIVLTDSGGIQEEAPGLGKPVLVMRDTTERPEAVVAGTVKLVGTDFNLIVNSCHELLNSDNAYDKMSKAQNPYGDGMSSKRIVDYLFEFLTKK